MLQPHSVLYSFLLTTASSPSPAILFSGIPSGAECLARGPISQRRMDWRPWHAATNYCSVSTPASAFRCNPDCPQAVGRRRRRRQSERVASRRHIAIDKCLNSRGTFFGPDTAAQRNGIMPRRHSAKIRRRRRVLGGSAETANGAGLRSAGVPVRAVV